MGQAPTVEAAVPDAVAPPPRHPRFERLDGMRAMSAFLVLLTHATVALEANDYAWWGRFTPHVGEVGLAALFSISGFLLFRPWLSARLGGPPGHSLRDFARHRLLRIFPALWLASVVLLILPDSAVGLTDPGLPQFALLQVYSEDWTFDGMKHSWTLAVELSFYALLPLYVIATRNLRSPRRETLVLLAIALVAPLTHYVVFSQRSHWLIALQTVLGYTDYIVIGMLLAVASVHARGGLPSWRPLAMLVARPTLSWALAVGVFALGVIVLAPAGDLGYPPSETAPRWVARHALLATVAALLMAPLVFDAGRWGVTRLLATPPVRWMGLVSYGIYLWHLPVVFWLRDRALHTEAPAPLLTFLLMCTALTLVLAAISYYAVERPILRLKNRGRAGPPGRSARPAAAR